MGWRILSKEDVSNSNPTRIINISTIKPEIYSSRPCPKGCSLSTGFAAKRKPINVTTDEPASEMLLNASAMMATEPARIPKTSFPINRRTLRIMPVNPAIDAYLPLTFTSVTSGLLPAKIRIRRSVIMYDILRRRVYVLRNPL